MAEDYYSQQDSAASPDESDAGEQDKPGDVEQEDSGNTTLVPASFFGDKELEVGKVCKVKVVHVFDDEVEIEKQDDYDESKPSEMSDADAMIDKMAAEEA